MNYSELLYKYKNKNTTLVQPEVRFGVLPHELTEKKLVSRYVYKYGLKELKEFVKEQYWKLVDFVPGVPGVEKEISYTRETGLELNSFKEISSKIGISSSQEAGVDGFKLRNEVSKELSRLTGESVTISEKTSKQHITKIPPQSFDWYFVIYQLIDVYTINTVRYNGQKPDFPVTKTIAAGLILMNPWVVLGSELWRPLKEVRVNQAKFLAASLFAGVDKKVEADIAEKNFESGLKQYSGMSDYIFKSHTFEVPTLYFCDKCDPPLN